MLFESTFSAHSLPDFPNNTVCLTFDDGPCQSDSPPTEAGPHSLELAQYLASEGVHATFFMVGRQLQQYAGVAAEISALGHQVGCHTYDHLGLDELLTANGDVVRQMALTSALVPPAVATPIYFRAPYGQWSDAVAQAMNSDFLTCHTSFGPIHWDNETTDWDKWLNGVDPQVVAQQYLDEINVLRKGVILMHDSTANNGPLQRKNRAYSLAQALVPRLKDAGYNLVRLDAVAELSARANTRPGIALRGANQMYISPQESGGGEILVSGAAPDSWERLTAVPLGYNRFAFQSPRGEFFSVQNTGGNPVTATAAAVGDWETFEAAPGGNGTTIFRTFTGDFLTLGGDTVLAGNGGPTDPKSLFSLFVYPAAEAAAAGGTI